jgi:hypothetical protein
MFRANEARRIFTRHPLLLRFLRFFRRQKHSNANGHKEAQKTQRARRRYRRSVDAVFGMDLPQTIIRGYSLGNGGTNLRKDGIT